MRAAIIGDEWLFTSKMTSILPVPNDLPPTIRYYFSCGLRDLLRWGT